MKHIFSRLINIVFLLFIFLQPLRAQENKKNLSDSIQISLLTCSPGAEIYSLFGHTALRYENFTQGIDIVFNYGLFSFNAPNFILRFALGETDYQLGISNYKEFMAEYSYFERSVWQQTLNLRQKEKEHLIQLLEENYRPENRMYRYNFFYDNCATRPRDQIEKAINGTLQYADNMTSIDTGKSFRDIIHQYTKRHEWAQFGIDFCIGSKADKSITRREMMFAPFYVKDFLSSSYIIDKKGTKRPLILAERKILDFNKEERESKALIITPIRASLLLFILITSITIYGIKHKKIYWGIDLVLFLTAGLTGCILCFLVLFSQHPDVSPNYLLLLFHPLHLFLLPWIITALRRKQRNWYFILNSIVLTFFMLLWWAIPQRIDLAILPLALCLWVRTANGIILTTKKKK